VSSSPQHYPPEEITFLNRYCLLFSETVCHRSKGRSAMISVSAKRI